MGYVNMSISMHRLENGTDLDKLCDDIKAAILQIIPPLMFGDDLIVEIDEHTTNYKCKECDEKKRNHHNPM